MKTIKLKIHSTVDLITNSSTVIFTYSEGSLPTLKQLVNEMLKSFDKIETFDDIFYAEVFLEDCYKYFETEKAIVEELEEDGKSIFDELSWTEQASLLENIKLQVLKGEIEKPEWMVQAENSYNYDDYRPDTILEILPKYDKYEALAKRLTNFLYSTDHEASYG